MFILLVEDDPLLRSAAKAILRKEGLEAILAGDGNDGYKIIQKLGDSIDLLLTDVNLPGMDGLSLANSGKTLYPLMPILLMTGEPSVFQNPPSTYRVLKKPFLANELVEAVRETMAIAAPSGRLRKPSRSEVVEQWRAHVQQLHQVSGGFSRQFAELVTEQNQGLIPSPDGSAAIHRARTDESFARREYIRALRILTDFIVSDQTPGSSE
jgi:DNA-binding NtrC family response regulator